jgi:glycosyltransferase involved in cell wall biosynthesis
MSPLVSVIVPVYNCETYVEEAIRSVLEQDYPAKEIIAVDDGSTDGTLAVLRGFGDHIRVVAQPNGGPPRARNAGLREARGDYIAFLDADDVWLQGKLSVQVAHMEANPDVGVCYTGWHVWAPGHDGGFRRPEFAKQPLQSVPIDPIMSGWIYGRLLFECELLTTTVMIRASVARAVGEFDIRLFNGDDYDYWIRLSQAGKITRLDCIGALYRVVPNSVSRKPRTINDEHLVIQLALERFGLTGPDGAEVDPAAMASHMDALVFQHGYLHLKRGDPRIALRAFAANLRRRPWHPKLWYHTLTALAKLARSNEAAALTR